MNICVHHSCLDWKHPKRLGGYYCDHWQPVRVTPGLLARLCPTLGWQSLAPIAEAPSNPSETYAGDSRDPKTKLITARPSDRKGARGEGRD